MKRTVYWVVAAVLVVSVLSLIGLHFVRANQATQERARIYDVVDSMIPTPRVRTVVGAEPSTHRSTMTSVNVGDHDFVGLLELPGDNLRVPVIDEWSTDNIHLSPAAFEGTAETGTLIIGGENTPGQFNKLTGIGDGDEAIFTDVGGNEYHYTATSVETIPNNNLDKLRHNNETWHLTLFAPSPTGSQLAVVRFKSTP